VYEALGGAVSIESELDPCVLVTEVGAPFESEARRRGLTLAAAVESGVPRGVRADRERLGAVLTTLLATAMRSVERGAIVLEVAAVARRADLVTLAFSVTVGAGIPVSAERDVARCRKLVRAIGGRLRLTPHGDGGCALSFRLALPYASERVADEAPATGRRVMVLSPGGTARDRLGPLLREPGICVDVHSDPGSALTALQHAARQGTPFQVLIVAVDPGCEEDALDLRDHVARHTPAGLELVLFDGSNDRGFRSRALRAGYLHVVTDLDPSSLPGA
jgi:hypothetical protein